LETLVIIVDIAKKIYFLQIFIGHIVKSTTQTYLIFLERYALIMKIYPLTFPHI